jgi:hypothetical protein
MDPGKQDRVIEMEAKEGRSISGKGKRDRFRNQANIVVFFLSVQSLLRGTHSSNIRRGRGD